MRPNIDSNYAIADGLYNLLFPDKTGINTPPRNKTLIFRSASTSMTKWAESKTQETLLEGKVILESGGDLW